MTSLGAGLLAAIGMFAESWAAAVLGAAGILEEHAAVLGRALEFFGLTSAASPCLLLHGKALVLFCLLRCCCCRLLIRQADGLFCSSGGVSGSCRQYQSMGTAVDEHKQLCLCKDRHVLSSVLPALLLLAAISMLHPSLPCKPYG
jgi:hypothetical protein